MQTFEIEIDGTRTEVGVMRFFDMTASGEISARDRVWLDGVSGVVSDVDERLVDGELRFYLKNTPQELEIERALSEKTERFFAELSERLSDDSFGSPSSSPEEEAPTAEKVAPAPEPRPKRAPRRPKTANLFWSSLGVTFGIGLLLLPALSVVLAIKAIATPKPDPAPIPNAASTVVAPEFSQEPTAPQDDVAIDAEPRLDETPTDASGPEETPAIEEPLETPEQDQKTRTKIRFRD
ncbi:MAG: hypothetical protein J6X44_00845 [Thermoguttaceae bacterium]|nr:hypothetical protein [Thermoguttaceae bacterium]